MQSRFLLYIKFSVVFVVVILLAVYFFNQSKVFLLGPQLKIDNPINGQTLTDSFVLVNGVASNVVALLINDQVILIDSFGNFNKNLILARGYNIIELIARDKFNREVYKKLEVTVK